MDAFEVDKVVGAVLASLLFAVVLNFVGDAIYEPKKLDKPVYFVGAPGEEAASEEGKTADASTTAGGQDSSGQAPGSLPALLAAADPDSGHKIAKKCASCHTFTSGGPNRVGPNLYGIVGAPIAAKTQYSYSNALKEHGGTWGFEELDAFLHKPKDFVSGTKMSFPGIAKAEERADVIVFLRSLSESPLPLPAQ